MAKKDMEKIMDKYRPMLKKFGNEVGEAAKKGEESVVTMSKVLRMQLDMLGISLQREKLYYEIGKDVAARIMKGSLEIEGFEKYKSRLAKMQSDNEKKKKAISKVRSSGKKKKVKKTKK